MESLNITEIYQSIQGEGRFTGWPCVFIRLAECPLRCKWCDTVYSFKKGEDFAFSDLLSKIDDYETDCVELTGGEPLAQDSCISFMKQLADQGKTVMIETSGAFDISKIDPRVHIIMDLKCPDSNMSDRNRMGNLMSLKPSDEIKFVVASEKDFHWAKEICEKHRLCERFQVLFSPAFGLMKEQELTELLLESKLKARLNVQIHKYIWSPRAKGV